MTWFDIAVLAILGVSMLLGLLRGLVKELVSLAAWIAAFFVARQFAASAAVLLPTAVRPDPVRYAVGFVLVLIAVLLVLWIVGFLMTELLKAGGLSGTNRALGALFGLARGAVIVTMAVILGGLTPLPQSVGWRNAWLSPPFEQIARSAKPWLPDVVRANIRYDED